MAEYNDGRSCTYVIAIMCPTKILQQSSLCNQAMILDKPSPGNESSSPVVGSNKMYSQSNKRNSQSMKCNDVFISHSNDI